MVNHGMLFIPDISGFTNFINKTEIEHSSYIIQELLEILVNSNNIGLKVSEIEGDAILFYKFGTPPSMDELYKQVETMFCNFHKRIKEYAERRMCPCKACEGTKDLTLKVITHQGEFSTYTVKDFNKLIGKDVIRAHQLLKNDIPLHEYWLVTDQLHDKENKSLPDWIEWKEGKKKADEDEIGYKYSLLTPLHKTIEADKPDFGIKGKRQEIFSVEQEIEVDIDTAFGVAVDLSRRAEWMDGINEIKDVSTKLPEVGTVHSCIVGRESNIIINSDFKRDDGLVIIEETGKSRIHTTQFILRQLGDKRTNVTFKLFLKKNPFLMLFFRLFMLKKFKKSMRQSLVNLRKMLEGAKAA